MDIILLGDEQLQDIVTESDLFIYGRIDDEALSAIARIREEYAEFDRKVTEIVGGSSV